MVEQEIARPIAQHLMQRLPRELGVEWRVEELLDPGRVQVFRRAIPGIAHGPDASLRRARPRRLVARTAISRVIVPHSAGASSRASLRVPCSRGRRRDLGEPEIRRSAVPLMRFGRDASIGRDQRELALERLLGGEDDAQGAPFQGAIGEAKTASSAASSQLPTGPCAVRPRREKEDEKCACDQQQCCHSSSNLACSEQLSPRSMTPKYTILAKASA